MSDYEERLKALEAEVRDLKQRVAWQNQIQALRDAIDSVADRVLDVKSSFRSSGLDREMETKTRNARGW